MAAIARALHVVAEVGAADAIPADGTVDISHIADVTGTDPDSLSRLLRALTGVGIFATDGRQWSHTPASALLRSDHPTSLRAFARMMGLPVTWDCLTDLRFSTATGRPVMSELDDGGLFGYLERHPDQQSVFGESMTSKSHGDIAGALAAVDFSRFATIVDIGGGRGHLLRAILDQQPTATGCVFDLPQVVAEVDPGVDGRLTTHAGDFFVGPVPRADLSILMHIIHDWNDEEAVAILSMVAAAAEPGDTLMLVEAELPEDARESSGLPLALDVLMLACTGGRERTTDHYRALLDAAGYQYVSATPTFTGMVVIEARRAG